MKARLACALALACGCGSKATTPGTMDLAMSLHDGGGGGGDLGGSSGGPDLDAPGIAYIGRVDDADPAGPRWDWSGSSLTARFTGTSVAIKLKDAANYYEVYVDGMRQPVLTTTSGTRTYTLASGLPDGTHTLVFWRRTEAFFGNTQILGLTFDPGRGLLSPPPPHAHKLELIGDSISCGYGDEGVAPCNFSGATENHYLSYGAVAARALDADLITVAWSGFGMYRNCCNNTDPPMPAYYDYSLPTLANHVAGGTAWDFSRYTPDAVIINLGTNDFSSGDPGQPYQDAYVAFVKRLRMHYPNALIVCAIGPGQAPATAIKAVVATLNGAGDQRVQFLALPQQAPGPTGCDGHPSVASHQLMGDALAQALKSALGW